MHLKHLVHLLSEEPDLLQPQYQHSTIPLKPTKKTKHQHLCQLMLLFYYDNILTKHDWNLLVWFLEWIWLVTSWQDDDRPINCCSKPWNMSMPEQSSPLTDDREVICVTLVKLYRTLCNICWSICPSVCKLPNSMPSTTQNMSIVL